MGKKRAQDVMSSTLRQSPGFTTCSACNRSMREGDVDAEGHCPDCAAPVHDGPVAA